MGRLDGSRCVKRDAHGAARWNQVKGKLRPSFLSLKPSSFSEQLLYIQLNIHFDSQCKLESTETRNRESSRQEETVRVFWCPSGCGGVSLVLGPTVGAGIWLQAEKGGDKRTANFLQVASGRF